MDLVLLAANFFSLDGSGKNAESERAHHSQNIESLQSRCRELERKMELQNVRHDELMLELQVTQPPLLQLVP